MYMYGGYKFNRQIALVNQCQLTKIAELPFNFAFGTCAQWNNEIYFCFHDSKDTTTYKNCYYSNDPLESFEKLQNSSNYDHYAARIAVTSGKKFSEIFWNFQILWSPSVVTWELIMLRLMPRLSFFQAQNRGQFRAITPLVSFLWNFWSFLLGGHVYDYAITAVEDTFYMFGGKVDWDQREIIASFNTETKEWKKCGRLNQPRSGHSLILHQGAFVIVGGYPNWPLGTERCNLHGDSILCTSVDPYLTEYKFWPEMMIVPSDYCEPK